MRYLPSTSIKPSPETTTERGRILFSSEQKTESNAYSEDDNEAIDFNEIVDQYFNGREGEEETDDISLLELENMEEDDEIWMMEFLEALEDVDEEENETTNENELLNLQQTFQKKNELFIYNTANSANLLKALRKGVVPTSSVVGNSTLPCDYGFDPLNLATKDYILQIQRLFLGQYEFDSSQKRPNGLILRDYREAEIRHGRIAMLAAVIWPIQQILDRLIIPVRSHDTTIVYGGTTLPYLSLVMTLFLLLLGYLDIYAQAVKQQDAGEAFLPGECFWDPLSLLDGASTQMKYAMQETELRNGRYAMVAVFFYMLQEAIFHKPLISLSWNLILFQPLFTIPEVQQWLDTIFAGSGVPLDFQDVINDNAI